MRSHPFALECGIIGIPGANVLIIGPVTELLPCSLFSFIKDYGVGYRFVEFMRSNVSTVSNAFEHSYQI